MLATMARKVPVRAIWPGSLAESSALPERHGSEYRPPHHSMTHAIGTLSTARGADESLTRGLPSRGPCLGLPPANEDLPMPNLVAGELIRAGMGSEGEQALREVASWSLMPTPEYERIAGVRVVVEELSPLLATTQVTHVRARLLSVGLSPQRLRELRLLLLAFIHLEASALCGAGQSEAASNSLHEDALTLRAELLHACRWNLRAARAEAYLARISNSSHCRELALDLTELADVIQQHAEYFETDNTFCAPNQVQKALALAAGLTAQGTLSAAEHCDDFLEDRLPAATLHASGGAVGMASSYHVFACLIACRDEICAAGSYALRATPQLSRAFARDARLSRRSSTLRSQLSARGDR